MNETMTLQRSLKIKLYIKDRNYTEWTFVDNETNNDIPVDNNLYLKSVNPASQKLFSRDVLELSMDDSELPKIERIHSHIQTCEYIAGVLVLEGNKTYGRTNNKKRLLYRCIPDDHRLPIFLVPYEIKLGFSKVYKNKFVIFRFDHWNEKHPHGILLETIGDIDNLEAFYEFQLYCKNLHVSISDFTNKTRSILNKKTNDEFVEQIVHNEQYKIEDRRSRYVFTIDPQQSLDYDDGFGIEKMADGNWCVSIYIANVFLWLETLGLWNSFSKRVATIYLPDRRRPMLPTILSDILCSLQKNQPRFSMVMDIFIDEEGRLIKEKPIEYKNALIEVKQNYCYEDPKMINGDPYYKQLFDISYLMDKTIRNSHDIVTHWMIQMNTFTGILMANKRIGIFRSAVYMNDDSYHNMKLNNFCNENGEHLNEDTVRIIRSWNNTVGQYIPFNDETNFCHSLIRNKVALNNATTLNSSHTNMYIHITSPIRRLIDLLNQIILMDKFSLITNISQDANKFLEDWMMQMDYINTSMRYIRKIQTSCELLSKCVHDPNIMENEYRGVVFDKIIKNDGFITYMVYLEELKLLSRITTQVDVANYSYHKFNLYLFEDEDKIKKKIRLQLVM
jgi:exoribonuclease R